MPERPDTQHRPGDDDAARVPPSLEAEITDFLDAMRVEAGLSRNTVSAYRSDLRSLALWLGGVGVSE